MYKAKPKPKGRRARVFPRATAAPSKPAGARVSLAATADSSKSNNRFKSLPKLPLLKASALGAWHADAAELEAKVLEVGGERKRVELKGGAAAKERWSDLVRKKKELAERLLAQYAEDYEASRGRSGDIKMLIATQRSGTAADKVSAFSVMVAENPIANLRSLDALLGMVTSKVGKRHALTGFETLKELFISSLLPDRKLKPFFQQPVDHLPESKDGHSLLLFWYWEECLKQRYERFIVSLEEASRDMLPILKDKALKTLYALLKAKPEQERRLLSALVNKLGDPENKAASSAEYHLLNLLTEHPNMKAVVIDEVDLFIFRPHLGLFAKYHAINFLSQFRLSHKGDGPKVARRLIDVYFAVFKLLISVADGGQKGNNSRKALGREVDSSKKKNADRSAEPHVGMDSRILSAILTGVNRAFPFVSSDEVDELIEVQTPMLFQLVHSKNFNVGIQALMLLDKIASKNQIVSDRFFRALYSKLLFPPALNSSKAEMFIGLLLRTMKTDVNLKRVCAFSKRLLQVALQQPPQYACGILFLLSEVLKARPPLWNMVIQNESIDEDLEHFDDILEETESGPNKASEQRENAVKVVENNDNINSNEDSSQDVDENADIASTDDDDDDASSDAAENLIKESKLKGQQESRTEANHGRHQGAGSEMKPLLPGGYNPRHREPSYCNGDHVSWWELEVLASHVHPSVATMAQTLLSGTNIVYYGNPLNDLSLTAFLDKFMEKKPKQSTWHGGSQIEPAKQLDMNHHLIGPEILSLAEADVPPEDLVFHKFYMNKTSSSKKPKKKKKKKAAADEAAEELFDVEGGDESDNDEIENMLDSADLSTGADGEYDYEDLDQVADEDDDDLLDASDVEADIPPDVAGEEDEGSIDEDDDLSDGIDIGDMDDNKDDNDNDDNEANEDTSRQKKRKRKSSGKIGGASPFASLEEYEHLLNEDNPVKQEAAEGQKQSGKVKKHSKRKKRRKPCDTSG